MERLIKKIVSVYQTVHTQLFKINDTPHKISLGLGLGIFSGILPGTGPLAALFLAFLFKANRASALLGSLLTNTWFSVITLILAIKTGSVLFGINRQEYYREWMRLIKEFRWFNLFKTSFLKIVLPVFIGYVVIALIMAILAYLISLILILRLKKNK